MVCFSFSNFTPFILAERDNFSTDIVSIVGTILIRAASSDVEPLDLKQSLFGSSGNEYPIGSALLEVYSVSLFCLFQIYWVVFRLVTKTLLKAH